jgi:hypothetical protein
VNDRIAAAMNVLPQGFTAYGTPLANGGMMLQGGSGNGLRQILINADGTTVIRAFSAAQNSWSVIANIQH